MISEYQNIKSFIKKKKTGSEPKMQSMFTKILAKTNTYLDEALQCNAILIATALHPSFRLSIFQKCFPTYHNYTHDLLEDLYNSRKTESSLTSTQSQPTPPSESENKDEQSHCALAKVDYFPDTVEVSSDDEISIYLGGKYKLPTSQANFPLKWWKVSSSNRLKSSITYLCHSSFIHPQEHSAEFPTLSLLARDYLACTATSASVERCFSAAADICGQDRGGLAARTIKRCVISHEWLVQGVKPNGPFEQAQAIVTKANDKKEYEKTRLIPEKLMSAPIVIN
jgi:hypothetical protein